MRCRWGDNHSGQWPAEKVEARGEKGWTSRQRSANFFYIGPDSKDFRLCSLDGLMAVSQWNFYLPKQVMHQIKSMVHSLSTPLADFEGWVIIEQVECGSGAVCMWRGLWVGNEGRHMLTVIMKGKWPRYNRGQGILMDRKERRTWMLSWVIWTLTWG